MERWRDVDLGRGDGLLVADVQNDFLPGGSLGVADGDRVIPVLNAYVADCMARGVPVFASRDWHPPGHCSFRAQGGPWPPHCLAGSEGAAFDRRLALPPHTVVVSKATDPAREAYSAFEGTELDRRLREADVTRLLVGGLATEYCVLATVRDGRAAGYAVVVLTDGIGAIDAEDGRRALAEMDRLGARLVRRDDVAA
jgi:nicotinamidase-related amidase